MNLFSKFLSRNFENSGAISAIFFQICARTIPQILSLLLNMVIANYLGIDLLGILSSSNALIGLIYLTWSTGLAVNYLRSNAKSHIYTFILIDFVQWCILLIPLLLFKNEVTASTIILFYFANLLTRLVEYYTIYLRLDNRDSSSIIPRSIPNFINIILFFTIRPKTPEMFALIYCIGYLGFLVYSGFDLFRERVLLKWREIKKICYQSIILSLSTLCTQIYGGYDQIILQKSWGNEDVGFYKIGILFASILMPVIGVFSYNYLSELRIKLNKQQSIFSLMGDQIKLHVIIGFASGVILFVMGPYLIPFLFGKDSSPAVPISYYFLIANFFNLISMVMSYTLIAIDREKEVLIITAIGAVYAFTLYSIVISKYGMQGAAISNLSNQILLFSLLITYFLFKRKDLKNKTMSFAR